jgi:predicted dehydrogenase
VAVIGVGRLGKEHARIYSTLPGVELVGVVDADAARAREVAERVGAPVCADVAALPAGVQAVSVAVPTSDHHAVAVPLLRRGVACLVEKPLASDPAQARELTDLARRHRVPLMVGHVERFNPVFQAVQELVAEPLYLEARRVSPFRWRSVDVGVALDVMIHDLDIVLHLVRSEPERVEAFGFGILTGREDVASARLHFKSGCVADLTASRVALKVERRLRSFSRDSYVSLDFVARKATLIQRGPGLSMRDFGPPPGAPPLAPGPDPFSGLAKVRELDLADDTEPLKAELEAFVDAVRSGRTPPVPGEDGLKAVELADEIASQIRAYVARHGR